ncbi:hypothetical protein FJK98_02515 [Micromonospora sp. HM134]|uniref:hypothetical protein n=1 Tax=Micromonospora sp. HM134 TaxID=2583243 RepID=UPI001198684F|nr:hypothetical protein [Micromonospora sp. HM134]QDY06174.1 hypothetical protein FJK98_02515 [Micromonospora sp. HM134]
MDDEPLYTLAEAEAELRRRQCAVTQHRLTPVDGSPCRLYCAGCDTTFDLVPVKPMPVKEAS